MPKSPAKRHSSLDYHVAQIEAALAKTRNALFEVVLAIRDARDALDQDVFQKDLAARLSISPSTLTKYLKIADCAPLMRQQKRLPPTLTTLYDLAQLHGRLIKTYGETEGQNRFRTLLSSNRIGLATEAQDIAPLLHQIKQRADLVLKKKREKDILLLARETVPQKSVRSFITMKELLAFKAVFRTILMTPPEGLLHKWNDEGFFVSQIAEDYPVADLRAPSQAETVQGFVYCRSELIVGGLKLLSAAGFTFRDIFVPYQPNTGFVCFGSERIILRGERGRPVSFFSRGATREDFGGVLDIADTLGEAPRLLVFAETVVEGWTCVATRPDTTI
jgi:hypothetical protein